MFTKIISLIFTTILTVLFPVTESFQVGNYFSNRKLRANFKLNIVKATPFESEDDKSTESKATTSKTGRIFFDIEVNKEEIGQLIFRIDTSEELPTYIYASNVMKLCTGARTSIDPKCKYVGCQFQHSPQSVETFPQYRWTHVLSGNARNAVGVPTERISIDPKMALCAHSLYGGQYYGRQYIPVDENNDDSDNPYGVYLTVPLVGPQRGSSSFSIVRVDESPQEWRERLLLNSAVLGILESGIETLWAMARQTVGPPTIIRSGIL